MEEPTCPKCHSEVIFRVRREGFLQSHILSFFLIYPWRCGSCGTTSMLKRRTSSRSRRSEAPGANKTA